MSTNIEASCELCGRPGGARRPGYDFLVCSRCAVPEPQGAMLGRNPTIAGEGAEPWEWRPDRWMRTEAGAVTWDQPDPPVHCKGLPPRSRGGGGRATPEALRRANDNLEASGCTLAECEVVILQAQGLSRAAIARHLGIGEESVKDRLKRAHARLKSSCA